MKAFRIRIQSHRFTSEAWLLASQRRTGKHRATLRSLQTTNSSFLINCSYLFQYLLRSPLPRRYRPRPYFWFSFACGGQRRLQDNYNWTSRTSGTWISVASDRMTSRQKCARVFSDEQFILSLTTSISGLGFCSTNSVSMPGRSE